MSATPHQHPHGDGVDANSSTGRGGIDGGGEVDTSTAMRATAAAAVSATAHSLRQAAAQLPLPHSSHFHDTRHPGGNHQAAVGTSSRGHSMSCVTQPPLRVSEALARLAVREAGHSDASHKLHVAEWGPAHAAPLHVLCACDTFKGTLAPDRVGVAAETGFLRACAGGTATGHDNSPTASTALPPVTSPPWSASDAASANAQPLVPTLAAAAAATSAALASSSPSSAAAPAVVFLHTPMSDGGAGLLDSVTYSTKTTTPATEGVPTTQEGSADPREGLCLQRIHVPASVPITGPLGRPIEVSEGAGASPATRPLSFACDVARRVLVVEMAEAAGLPRIARPQDRHPGRTTSYGVGELIRYAVSYITAHASPSPLPSSSASASISAGGGGGGGGVRLFLGIGGSATNDGGLGALQALGLRIFVEAPHAGVAADGGSSVERPATDVLLDRPLRGEDLAHITRVAVSDDMRSLFPYLSPSSRSPTAESPDVTTTAAAAGAACGGGGGGGGVCEVCLICDVDNALVGPRGATYTFGPQKCAPPPPTRSPAFPGNGDSGSREQQQQDGDGGSEEAGDDAAVGAVTSAAQQRLLDSLEAGMHHAGARVVASTWRDLVSPDQLAHLRQHPPQQWTTPSSAADALAGEDDSDEAAVRAELLHRPGGGGAGGMSGMFRYLLRACYVPGADMVGGLLGVYETPRVTELLGSSTHSRTDAAPGGLAMAAVRHPRGCLFHSCDILFSGEGSFDGQTILSHKTVGRLLEMCAAANGFRLWQHYCADRPAGEGGGGCRCITDVVVVCGRCGFGEYAGCQAAVLEAVCSTLDPCTSSTSQDADVGRLQVYLQALTQSTAFRRACGFERPQSPGAHDAETQAEQRPPREQAGVPADWTPREVLAAYCVPRVTVLPLTPTLFSVSSAMQQPFECAAAAMTALVQEAVRRLPAASQEEAHE